MEQNAAQDHRGVNDIVNEAVAQYLRDCQQTKIDREIAAYEAMHAQLARDYMGEWVAVHGQKLVDHDSDRVALYRRIRDRYDRTAVLLRQVTSDQIEEVWLRTSTSGKIAS